MDTLFTDFKHPPKIYEVMRDRYLPKTVSRSTVAVFLYPHYLHTFKYRGSSFSLQRS